eukprot:5143050-Amphidinium_carterae.1
MAFCLYKPRVHLHRNRWNERVRVETETSKSQFIEKYTKKSGGFAVYPYEHRGAATATTRANKGSENVSIGKGRTYVNS